MALTISETWIRERVGLKHNNLEDVRSLSLPGTYHEKIAGLGDSLRKFSRLKSLDLSRNAIETLEGLDGLKMLEKLNLYYNSVSSLQEIYRLRFNQKLQELDLRLNPVARNEPDYRLFIIHMLPNLRRLDDRAVRDSERKAALMHYASDAATQFTEHEPPEPSAAEPPRQNPRAQHVKSLARPRSAVDNDDAVILDYGQPGYDPKAITGSAATQPSVEDYPSETLWQLNKAGVGLKPGLNPGRIVEDPAPQPPPQQQIPIQLLKDMLRCKCIEARKKELKRIHKLQNAHKRYMIEAETEEAENHLKQLASRYPNIPFNTMSGTGQGAGIEGSCKLDPPLKPTDSATSIGSRKKVEFDPTMSYNDDIDSYTSYQSSGNFTPTPKASGSEDLTQSTEQTEDSMDGTRGVEMYQASDFPPPPPPPQAQRPQSPPHQPQQQAAEKTPELTGEFGEMIMKVSTMVDKYWNGSKSLLTNQRFISQMSNLLRDGPAPSASCASASSLNTSPSTRDYDVTRLRAQLEKARQENEDLKERLFSSALNDPAAATGDAGDKGKGLLVRTQRDLKIMRDRLQKSMDENKVLSEKLQQLQASEPQQQQQHRSRSDVTGAADTPQLEQLKAENAKLRESCGTLNIRLKQSAQMQELAAMLQESHKSLVASNEQLLRELEETRRRHQDELQHLNSAHQLQLRRATQPQHQHQQHRQNAGAN